jgi:hypothetical protein
MIFSSKVLTVAEIAVTLALISCMNVGTVSIIPSTVAFNDIAAGVSMAAFISA